jgi:hypothetical protein
LKSIHILTKLHSFEVIMYHGLCNAHQGMFYAIMIDYTVHGLYAGECPLKLCIMEFEGTCPRAPTLAQVPLNSMMHSLKACPYAGKLHVVNITLLISITIFCGTDIIVLCGILLMFTHRTFKAT